MKKHKTVLGVYFPADLRDWVEATSIKENRSLSNQVVQLLTEARMVREGVAGGKK